MECKRKYQRKAIRYKEAKLPLLKVFVCIKYVYLLICKISILDGILCSETKQKRKLNKRAVNLLFI